MGALQDIQPQKLQRFSLAYCFYDLTGVELNKFWPDQKDFKI